MFGLKFESLLKKGFTTAERINGKYLLTSINYGQPRQSDSKQSNCKEVLEVAPCL